MATFKHSFPASLRAVPSAARETRSGMVPGRRPYLVTQARNPVAASARQQIALFPHESEDARLTGATRSLYRRLLALNLPRAEMRFEAVSQPPRQPIGRRPVLSGVLTA